ncbi:Hypothetical protein NGAL_HAMBI2605_14660 [Neorhizobium galegae bv. orientalis]|nr:Hypothetical protein NGAL_HAMBI2605_14660 [Neorhizobium galegae bv. orientalis]
MRFDPNEKRLQTERIEVQRRADLAVQRVRDVAARADDDDRVAILRSLEQKISQGADLGTLERLADAAMRLQFARRAGQVNDYALRFLVPALLGVSASLVYSLAVDFLGYQPPDLFGFLPSPTDVLRWVAGISPYLVTPLGVALALMLFGCRGYLPSVYGFLEILVGIWTIDNTAPAVSLNNFPSLIPFLAGIYVVIRGLDNFAKSLNPASRVGRFFSAVFNNPKSGSNPA